MSILLGNKEIDGAGELTHHLCIRYLRSHHFYIQKLDKLEQRQLTYCNHNLYIHTYIQYCSILKCAPSVIEPVVLFVVEFHVGFEPTILNIHKFSDMYRNTYNAEYYISDLFTSTSFKRLLHYKNLKL